MLGLGALVLIDGSSRSSGSASSAARSGWLAAILPALLFFDDLRAWRGQGVRILVASWSAAGVAIGLGLLAAAAVSGLPPMVSGAVGATVAALVYSFVWFVGIRWLTGRARDGESR